LGRTQALKGTCEGGYQKAIVSEKITRMLGAQQGDRVDAKKKLEKKQKIPRPGENPHPPGGGLSWALWKTEAGAALGSVMWEWSKKTKNNKG